MTEQVSKGLQPDVLVVRRGEVPSYTFEALGAVAQASGCAVEYHKQVPESIVAASGETSPAVYATESDFRDVAAGMNKHPSRGTMAWGVLMRDYVAAQRQGTAPAVQFMYSPGRQPDQLTTGDITEMDIHSLAKYVALADKRIAGRTLTSARYILNKILPSGAASDTLNIWRTAVAQKLENEATSELVEPVYATYTDFIQIGRMHGESDPESAKAWDALHDDFIRAHQKGRDGDALVDFATHPPFEEPWDRRATVDDLDVYSLDQLVGRVAQAIKGQSLRAAKRTLTDLLPPSLGMEALRFWNTVVAEMFLYPLPPTRETRDS